MQYTPLVRIQSWSLEIKVTSFAGEFVQTAVYNLLPKFVAFFQFLAHASQFFLHSLQHQFTALLSHFEM